MCSRRPTGPIKRRARFVGVIANRDHVIEPLPQKFIHGFGPVRGDIDPDLRHGRDRRRIDPGGRPRPGRVHLERGIQGAQPCFRHLAARRVARAQDENAGHVYRAGLVARTKPL